MKYTKKRYIKESFGSVFVVALGRERREKSRLSCCVDCCLRFYKNCSLQCNNEDHDQLKTTLLCMESYDFNRRCFINCECPPMPHGRFQMKFIIISSQIGMRRRENKRQSRVNKNKSRDSSWEQKTTEEKWSSDARKISYKSAFALSGIFNHWSGKKRSDEALLKCQALSFFL
jgi:hypothetical protein